MRPSQEFECDHQSVEGSPHLHIKCDCSKGSVVAGAALWAAIASALAAKSGVDLWGPLLFSLPVLDPAASGAVAAEAGTDALTAVAAATASMASQGASSSAAALSDTVLGGIIGSHPGQWDSPGQWAQLLLTSALSPAGDTPG